MIKQHDRADEDPPPGPIVLPRPMMLSKADSQMAQPGTSRAAVAVTRNLAKARFTYPGQEFCEMYSRDFPIS